MMKNVMMAHVLLVSLLSGVELSADEPFYPHVSIGWDNNPRYKRPQSIVADRTPEQFAKFLVDTREYVDKHNLQPGLITINSWNEWSEGSYLEPDQAFGMKYLEAVRDVFGADGNGPAK